MNDENLVNTDNQEYRIVNGLKLPPKRVVKLPTKRMVERTDLNDEPKEWFCQNLKTGEELGPLSQSQVCSLVARKEINRDTLMWKSGMEEWRKASELELFSETVNSERPLLPASAVSDKWAFCLATIPILVYCFLCALQLGSIAWLPCIVLNCIFAWKDTRLLERCRRDMTGCLVTLACTIVPLYLLFRAIKLGGGAKWLPLVIWFFFVIFLPLILL